MPQFSPEHWQALSPYLDQALEIPAEERPAWLQTLRKQNPTLAADLQTLLDEHHALNEKRFLEEGAEQLPRPRSLAGQRVGAYTLDHPIGQGGMGTVWLAHRSDGRFEGRAAVKFLSVALLGQGAEARFRREGSILARLAHQNIAHLVDAGVSSTGQPYLVLEYVEGEHIDAYCNQHALDLEARLRLFLEVMAAVGHAHANLIVHRDLKPSNVLVTKEGHVKLLDFGIAKLLEDEAPSGAATVLTRQGETVLTLAYAAPEQVTGGAITTGTDVYALGVVLYLLLAGKHPAEFALHSQPKLIKAIAETEPARPSDVATANNLRRELRGDLDTIVAQALKKNPTQRYASVTAFADDLRRYLSHQTISARPDTLAYRVKKFVGRNKTAVALASAGLVATVAGVVGTVIQARTARIERDFALRQLSRAEAINDLNSFVLSDAAPSGKPFTVTDLLSRAEQMVGRQQNTEDVNHVELFVSIGRQYADLGQQAKALRLLDQAYALARGLPEPSARARTSCALAKSLVEIDLPRAERLIQEGLKELPNEARFALERVFCLQLGGEVSMRRGEPQDAIKRAQAAQDLLSQLPFRSDVLELDNVLLLASAYWHANLNREANVAFEQASTRLKALGRDNTHRAASLFTDWGLMLWGAGRPLDAERALRRAISLSQDDQGQAKVPALLLVSYARSLKDLGRLNDAAEYAERAHAQAEAAGDQAGINQALLVRQTIYRSQGDLERAAQTLSKLESALRPKLPPNHIAFASIAWQWALIAQGRGQAQTALDLINQAVSAAETAIKEGREGAGFVDWFLMCRSEIQLQLGHKDEAEKDARRALVLLQAVEPEAFSVIIGRAYLALGRALQAQGKREEASAAFRSAVEHMQSTLGPDNAETQTARKLAEQ